MSPQVVPTTRQTYRRAAQVLGRAFADEPVSIVVYRNFSPEQRARALTVDFSAELVASLRLGYPIQVIDDDKIVAAALIYPPGAYPLSRFEQWIFLFKSVLGNGWYDVRSWVKWINEVEKVHPTKPHYYLEYIGVEPTCQGMGYGSAIMEHLVAKADQEGVGCYLENANPHNISFYKRFGFAIANEKQIIGFTTWFMWRAPIWNPHR